MDEPKADVPRWHMPLDVHKVRQLCTEADRNTANSRRDVERIMAGFRNLGSSFTGDRLYSREYQQLDSAIRDAVRALAKVEQAIRDISRKA